MSKRLVENFDRCRRCDFARFRAANSVCDSEDRALRVVQKGVFVQWATLVQAAVRNCCGVDLEGFSLFAHCTASSFSGEELLATGLSAMILSWAFRFENAI